MILLPKLYTLVFVHVYSFALNLNYVLSKSVSCLIINTINQKNINENKTFPCKLLYYLNMLKFRKWFLVFI